MKDVIKYKDHIGTVRFSAEDKVFYGKIEGINDLITFEGKSVDDLVSAFQEAVEDYYILCEKANKPVQKSYKGSFNIRIDPELHKEAAILSSDLGLSLNELVEEAIQKYVKDKNPQLNT